jgi:hypothetical protein
MGEYSTSFQGDFKPIGSMLQPQQPHGQAMGTKQDGFRNSMTYNM